MKTAHIPGLSAEERRVLEDACSPMMNTLPMGWPWAVFFCQAAVESAFALAGVPAAAAVHDISSRSPILRLSPAGKAKIKAGVLAADLPRSTARTREARMD